MDKPTIFLFLMRPLFCCLLSSPDRPQSHISSGLSYFNLAGIASFFFSSIRCQLLQIRRFTIVYWAQQMATLILRAFELFRLFFVFFLGHQRPQNLTLVLPRLVVFVCCPIVLMFTQCWIRIVVFEYIALNTKNNHNNGVLLSSTFNQFQMQVLNSCPSRTLHYKLFT